MSEDEIRARQMRLLAAGFDPGPVDGIDGPRTGQAQADFEASQVNAVLLPVVANGWVVDFRSSQNIATLLSPVRLVATEFLHRLALAGIEAKIISALRTWNEQDALYAQGRTTKGDKVTNARGGYSNHNFGVAFDIGMFAGGKYLDDEADAGRVSASQVEALYDRAAPIGKKLGLSWGGDWSSPVDKPHYEFRPPWALGLSEREMLAQFRARKMRGQDLWT